MIHENGCTIFGKFRTGCDVSHFSHAAFRISDPPSSMLLYFTGGSRSFSISSSSNKVRSTFCNFQKVTRSSGFFLTTLCSKNLKTLSLSIRRRNEGRAHAITRLGAAKRKAAQESTPVLAAASKTGSLDSNPLVPENRLSRPKGCVRAAACTAHTAQRV